MAAVRSKPKSSPVLVRASRTPSETKVSVSLCSYNGDESVHHALGRFEDVSSVAEAAALGLYLGTARKAARPLLRGKQSRLFLFGAVAIGLVAPALLRRSK
jgi:hypothetical protein